MQAEKALKHSQDKLIVADASRGLVLIQQQCSSEHVLIYSFPDPLCPPPRAGARRGFGITTVGSYDDLDIAVTIASVKYMESRANSGCLPAGTL